MNFKRLISAVLVSVMAATFICPAVFADGEKGFSESFSAQETGKAPKGFDVSSGWGSVTVKEDGDNKYLAVETDNDGAYVTVSRYFEGIQGVVTAKADFTQRGAKSDGNVIMQILEDEAVICSVETAGGSIVFVGAETTEMVSNYEVGRTYNLHLEIDVEGGTAKVYVDGTEKADAAALLSARPKINGFKSYAFMSPGYALDNILVAPSEVISGAEMEGAETQSIPPEGSAVYEYTAEGITAAGEAVDTASFDFSLDGAPEGVSIEATGPKTAKVTVTSVAPENATYNIVAILVGDPTCKAQKTVTLRHAALSRVEVHGTGAISLYLLKAGDSFTYTASAIDEFGNPMTGETFTWELSGPAKDFFALSQSGVLTVKQTGDITSEVYVTASLASDNTKKATKKIRLSDVKTYLNDKTRREIIKEYMDTALEYAKDTYNGSPRLADGITKDGTHVLWHFTNGDKVPLADMGNEWELLRTMIAYSDTGGDPYYKERAYELYKFTMENDVSPNNLVYWGSHCAIDLRSGKRNQNMGDYHEIEEKDMYFAPFYEIDRDKAISMAKAIWMGHIINWENLMFNRHAYYTKNVNEAKTWANVDQYDEEYYKTDPYIRDYEGCTFFLAASEYISVAVELYNKTGDETALTWARRMAERFANLADPITGIMPTLYATPYGDPNTVKMPEWVLQLDSMPYNYRSSYYGDRVYVQFADDMEKKGLITAEEKPYILEMYYNRNWPWTYGRSMFSILELVNAMGLEDENDAGYELFKLWMHGYKSYIDLAYEGSGKISVSFAHGIKLDKYVTAVPGYTSNKGSMLDQSDVGIEEIVPAVAAIFMMDKFPDLKDEQQTVWDFVNSMTEFYDIGRVGQPTDGIAPSLNFHTSNDDPNALNAMLELYRHTGIEDYLEISRVIANNIVEQKYDAGFFVPSTQYASWTSLHEPLVLMKLDAIINGEWSDALDFSFQSYVYHQTYYVNDHGRVPTIQHSDKYTEKYVDVLAKKIVTDKTSLALRVGDVEQIKVEVLPDDAASKAYYWEISDPSVIKIDDDNNIYAVGRGEAIIRAVINDTAIESEDIHITVD